MRAPKPIANPCLAALIRGAGFVSLDRFAAAVNERGWEMHGIKVSYDHIAVKRWLGGSLCQYPDVVAAVLSDAWNVPVPVEVIWPELRDGAPALPAYLQPWVAQRTLDELGTFLRSDMLTRRETLAVGVKAITGPALLGPIVRWMGVPPGRLSRSDEGRRRVGVADVVAIERSTQYFAGTDAAVGGTLSREAAVGQLKYAVDLLQHARYSASVGDRLLAAVAELSGLVGYLCHDSGMPGPAQRYFLYGLQAARESADARAALLVVSILADMAQHMRWLGRPNTALHLHDLALNQLPADRRQCTVLRAVLATKRAEDGLCYLGSSCLPEVRSILSQSLDLYAQASAEDRAAAPGMWHRAVDMSEAGSAGRAAAAYLVLAKENRRLAAEAEERTLYMLSNVSNDQQRDMVLSRIRLARVRFAAGEPEQASDDGDQALDLAEDSPSTMVNTRLRELLADAEPYARLTSVKELRERVRGVLTT